MAPPADPAVRGGRVLDQALVGLDDIIYVLALVAVDAADLPVQCAQERLVDAPGVPAPHLRGGHPSAGYCRGGACAGRAIGVHLLEVRMALDALAAR